jgi:hypothetical protein
LEGVDVAVTPTMPDDDDDDDDPTVVTFGGMGFASADEDSPVEEGLLYHPHPFPTTSESFVVTILESGGSPLVQ